MKIRTVILAGLVGISLLGCAGGSQANACTKAKQNLATQEQKLKKSNSVQERSKNQKLVQKAKKNVQAKCKA